MFRQAARVHSNCYTGEDGLCVGRVMVVHLTSCVSYGPDAVLDGTI